MQKLKNTTMLARFAKYIGLIMKHGQNSTNENLIFAAGLFAISVIFVYMRFPMLNVENSLKFWDSDYAIYVMQGEDIKTLKDFAFYYWGGNYQGPFNSTTMAFTQIVLEWFGYTQEVPVVEGKKYVIGPLAASLTCLWTFFTGTIFFGLAFRRLYNVWESLAACLLISVGGAIFMRFSLRPLGPEVSYFLGGLLLWRGLHLVQSPNRFNKILFGFLFGFSWWMNQITVFVLVPVFFYFIAKTPEYENLRHNPRILDRLLLRTERFGMSTLSPLLKFPLLGVYFLALLNFLMGLVISLAGGVNDVFWGIKLKIGNGVSPMKTSVLIFLGTQLLIWFFRHPKARETSKKILFQLKPFLIGFFVGYGPVILGRIFNLYEKGYKPQFIIIPLEHLFGWWYRLFTDFIPKLVLPDSLFYTLPFFTALCISLIYIFWSSRKTISSYLLFKAGQQPQESLLWGTVLFNLIYLLICDRSRDQYAFRYAILSLPILSIYTVTLYRKLRLKALGVTLTFFLALTFGIGQYQQGQSYLNKMTASPSLVPKMQKLIDSKCDIFFSNYWNTYIYEYLLQHEKRFAVIRGQDRTPKITQELKSSDLKKCDLNEENFQIKEL